MSVTLMSRMERAEYQPETWNDDQRAIHASDNLDHAMYQASCLAGGWYRRPVRVDGRITKGGDEEYSLRPADVPTPDGWRPYYTITAHHSD